MTEKAGSQIDAARLVSAYLASPRGRESARRLLGMRNRCWGQRAYVIGNGPSLKNMDLSPLANEYTFGSNRIYLAFDDIGFHTTFLSAIAEQIIKQFGDEMTATASEVFMSHRWACGELLPRTLTSFVARPQPGFGRNPVCWGLHEGGTVTYCSLQLAYFFGFKEVVLIGVDHSFVETGIVAAERLPQKRGDLSPAMVVSHGDDPNHFTPGYFGPGVKWQLPDWIQMEQGYRRARSEYERAGRVIVDATADGSLTVFPKVAYEQVLRQHPLRLDQ